MIDRAPDPLDYPAEAGRLLTVAALVQGLDLRGLIEVSQRADSVGLFLDPTAWQRSTHDHRAIAELAHLLLPFQKRGKEISDEVAARRAQQST